MRSVTVDSSLGTLFWLLFGRLIFNIELKLLSREWGMKRAEVKLIYQVLANEKKDPWTLSAKEAHELLKYYKSPKYCDDRISYLLEEIARLTQAEQNRKPPPQKSKD